MSIQRRIYLRTMWFVAYNWAFPFFLGTAFSLGLITWAEQDILDLAEQSFTASFDAVISRCSVEAP